ncbi:uncharacterized protein UTRI_02353 [Ustilago trichophora]|uniref:Uncharacterized protein n=1 Tax=Ustilago trichophora TaxID=86804 RepID=A0A5C3EA73_9BASI|nr:uncharacterized protein UTRI_02353 [Ustilago trichophora]
MTLCFPTPSHPFPPASKSETSPVSDRSQEEQHNVNRTFNLDFALLADLTSSSASADQDTNHILTLPIRNSTFPHTSVHLQSDLGEIAICSLYIYLSTTARSLLPTIPIRHFSDQDEAIEPNFKPPSSLLAAQTTPPHSTPMGSLASDFALAMYTPQHHHLPHSPSYKREPLSTPISTTQPLRTSSLATTMSKRIALKLQSPTLSLPRSPPGLLPVPALRDACASALTL